MYSFITLCQSSPISNVSISTSLVGKFLVLKNSWGRHWISWNISVTLHSSSSYWSTLVLVIIISSTWWEARLFEVATNQVPSSGRCSMMQSKTLSAISSKLLRMFFVLIGSWMHWSIMNTILFKLSLYKLLKLIQMNFCSIVSEVSFIQ